MLVSGRVNWWIWLIWVGDLDFWDPRKCKGLWLWGTPRIPNQETQTTNLPLVDYRVLSCIIQMMDDILQCFLMVKPWWCSSWCGAGSCSSIGEQWNKKRFFLGRGWYIYIYMWGLLHKPWNFWILFFNQPGRRISKYLPGLFFFSVPLTWSH